MHKSVLLDECIKHLNLREDSIIVDCTLGYGGHSSVILRKLKRGFLFAFDQDKEAIEFSDNRLKEISNNYTIIKSNFVDLEKELRTRNVNEVDGILYDLGVSSPQLDVDRRGFSFHNDAVLDMRMDLSNELTAKKVVNEYEYKNLVDIFYKYGDEKYASGIAKKIIEYRVNKEIETTLELVEIIKNGVPQKYTREKHPGRKVFQAIRIEVNKELEVFESSLYQALDLIKIGGRVCVITFHSLEDRICKQIFKEKSDVDKNLKNMPIIPEHLLPNYKIIGSFEPELIEVEENNRARSAKLRVIERIK